jgi:hypothetical protein
VEDDGVNDGSNKDVVEYIDQTGREENNNDLIFQQFQINQKQNYNIYTEKVEKVDTVGTATPVVASGDLLQFDNNQGGGSQNLIDFGNNNVSAKSNPNLIDLNPNTTGNANLIDFGGQSSGKTVYPSFP